MSPSVVLFLALVGVSFAGPLVRLSHAHPIAIASWRLAFSLVVIAVALALTGEWRQWARLSRREVAVGAHHRPRWWPVVRGVEVEEVPAPGLRHPGGVEAVRLRPRLLWRGLPAAAQEAVRLRDVPAP